MPVEIRELVIKTEIQSQIKNPQELMNKEQVRQLKQQILDDCLKQLQFHDYPKNRER